MAVSSYYLFEINMIDKWHDYYLYTFLPQIFLIVLYGMHRLLKGASAAAYGMKSLSLPVIIFLLALAPKQAINSGNYRWNPDPMNADLIKHKHELRYAVPDSSLVVVANDV